MTSLQLQMVTGDMAPMAGRGTLLFTVGDLSVTFSARVAEVQDPCILGLGFLRSTGCVVHLWFGELVLLGGHRVRLTTPSRHVPSLSVGASISTTSSAGCSNTSLLHPNKLHPG